MLPGLRRGYASGDSIVVCTSHLDASILMAGTTISPYAPCHSALPESMKGIWRTQGCPVRNQSRLALCKQSSLGNIPLERLPNRPCSSLASKPFLLSLGLSDTQERASPTVPPACPSISGFRVPHPFIRRLPLLEASVGHTACPASRTVAVGCASVV